MKRVKQLTLVLLALALSHTAFAWNNFGHEVIAYVAEQHLTPKAKEACRKYLNHSLPYYATWMDYYRHFGVHQPTSYWHGLRTDNDGILVKVAHGNGAGLFQTERIIKEMKNYKNMPDSVVRQNIIYLIHMIPDMHCPVHVSFPKKAYPHYRYSVRNKGKKLAIHKYWDDVLGFYRKNWDMRRYYEKVDKLTPKQQKQYMKGTPQRWAEECLRMSHKAYKLTPANEEVRKISKEKRNEILKYADERALKGGYRLAATLNKIFK